MSSWKYGLIEIQGTIQLAEIYWLKKGSKPSTFALVTLDEFDKGKHAMAVIDIDAQYRFAKIFKYPEDFLKSKRNPIGGYKTT